MIWKQSIGISKLAQDLESIPTQYCQHLRPRYRIVWHEYIFSWANHSARPAIEATIKRYIEYYSASRFQSPLPLPHSSPIYLRQANPSRASPHHNSTAITSRKCTLWSISQMRHRLLDRLAATRSVFAKGRSNSFQATIKRRGDVAAHAYPTPRFYIPATKISHEGFVRTLLGGGLCMLVEREPDRQLDSKDLCVGEGSHSLVLAVTLIERAWPQQLRRGCFRMTEELDCCQLKRYRNRGRRGVEYRRQRLSSWRSHALLFATNLPDYA